MEIGLEIVSAGEDDPALAQLFRESIILELNLAGLMLGSSSSPDVLIRVEYNAQDGDIRYRLAATASVDSTLIYETEAREQLALAFDTILLGQAEALAAAVLDYAEAREELVLPREEPPEKEEPIETEASVEEEKADEDTAAAEAVEIIESEEADETVTDMPETGMVYAADLGLFLAAGEAGRYFKFGIWPSLFVGYQRSPESVLGASLGVMYFRAEGFAAGTHGFLLSLIPEYRYQASTSGFVQPKLKLGLGGGLLAVLPDGRELQYKPIPAAAAGMGADLHFSRYTLQLLFDAVLFVDGLSLIYGFSPRIGVSF